MARKYAVDDSDWYEVKYINGYALFMGYLMMGVRGLGLLIITWTTVVLLGGFVSDLGKEDFWCLTGITLIQTAGVFNFLLTEKLSDMLHLSWGLLGAAVGTFRKDKAKEAKEVLEVGTFQVEASKRLFLAFAVLAIQRLVLFVILFPVSILYVFGIYISAGASLWRLIKHDFGNDGDGGANMKPALQVLYSLAVAQGILFGYKTIHAFAAKTGLVKFVYDKLNDTSQAVHEALVAEYLEETVAGCEKDPSFATGRNLVTHGVDLMMEAKSNESFITGIKVLGGAINCFCFEHSRMVLAKYLLTRPDDSSRAIIQRLLETVGPRSPYSREIKGHVVRILDIIAPCIRLEQFPRAIECLCSVMDTSESDRLDIHILYGSKFMDYERVELLEEYQINYVIDDLKIDSPKGTLREKLYQCLPCKWLLGKRKKVENENKREEIVTTDFNWLLIEAVNMIHKLVADEDNRWILRTCVSNTVLHKIATLPAIKSYRESHDNHVVLQMLEKCWELTEWLLVALTETSSPPLLPATATPVVEGQQRVSQGIEEEVEDGEEQLLVTVTSRPPILPVATPVGEGWQIRRRTSEDIEEEGEGKEQLPDLRYLGGSALGSRIKHTIKHSIESAVKCILDCLDCEVMEKRHAILFLLHRSLDMSTIVKDSESSRRLCWILLLIFCFPWNVDDGINRLAGEKLSEMLREKHGELPLEESERELQLIDLALEDLNRGFHDVDISVRTNAVIIMGGLFGLYVPRSYKQVDEFLADATPELVKETLIVCGSKTEERQEKATDLEKGEVSQDNQDGCIDTQRLQKALVSLCFNGCDSSSKLKAERQDEATDVEKGKVLQDNQDGCIDTQRLQKALAYLCHYFDSSFKEIASKTCEEQGKSFEDSEELISQYI